MTIEHEYILNPITALQFYQKNVNTLLLLAGEGLYLKTYDVSTTRILSHIQIFINQVIHGITVREEPKDESSLCVVIWGGSQLVLLTKRQMDLLLEASEKRITPKAITVPDWILDISLSPFEQSNCAMVTAHNAVLMARLNETGGEAHLKMILSPTNTSLYSACLIWDFDSTLLVVSGTVFGEIIASQYCLNGTSQILSRFKGHEGSVFGVDISPKLLFPDGRVGRLLASCSDDRTIRIWDLATDHVNETMAAIPLYEGTTGLGQGDCENSSPLIENQIAVTMGHSSRIWRVKFILGNLDDRGQTLINLMSFGEDAATYQWVLRLRSHPNLDIIEDSKSLKNLKSDFNQGEIIHLRTFKFHSGKHIWSSSLRRLDQRNYRLVTGGADGKISLFNVQINEIESSGDSFRNLQEKSERTDFSDAFYIFDLTSIFQSCHSQGKLVRASSLEKDEINMKREISCRAPKDYLNRYTFLSNHDFLVTTTLGRVIRGSIKDTISWTELSLPQSAAQDLKSCVVIKAFTESETAYLAGANGAIYAYSSSRGIRKFGHVEGKVADMFKVSEKLSQIHALLLTTLHSKVATIFHLDKASYGTLKTCLINLPDKFVVTSAEVVNGLLLLGSRSGYLTIYYPEQPEMPLEVCKATGKNNEDAITSIIPIASARQDSRTEYFVTTCRNGTYSIFSIGLSSTKDDKSSLIQIVHCGEPPFGPMIESAWFQNQELFLYGFKGKCFIVWNETNQSEIVRVDCGGAHRSYAYTPSDDKKGGYLIYTKASKLHIFSHKFPSHQVLKNGGHGREIKSCAISEDNKLMATGAEDTLIRIWKIYADEVQDRKFQCLSVLRRHTTGIQQLQWIGSKFLFSSGGNEEFFIWTTHSIPNFGVGLVCEAFCPSQSEDKDLRITCFDVALSPDSQTPNEILLSLGYSDSTFCSYRYSFHRGFIRTAMGRYTSSCITQIRNICILANQICLITATTDGVLAIWNSNTTEIETSSDYSLHSFKLLSAKKVHQSSIKSFDMHLINENLVVLTGGDDNAISISIYDRLDLGRKPSSFLLDSAHAAAITGLAAFNFTPLKGFLNCEKGFELHMISSSTDQKINMWILQISFCTKATNITDVATTMASLGNSCETNDQGNPSVEIQLRKSIFTPVADVTDLTVFQYEKGTLRNTKVLVVGNGLDVWSVGQSLRATTIK
ncbi:putative WD repeat-containing protein [Golovinomyces cichoracearum]|uniref:Putative WD repeat-containing protein n=1 Tax=Golovinomyces cichoracearum TaxID=62708 RepID=A0A420IVI1_9PEZI|nr:putative WD repeat-containing protein [Golovinomyces cichoracearum]